MVRFHMYLIWFVDTYWDYDDKNQFNSIIIQNKKGVVSNYIPCKLLNCLKFNKEVPI